MQERNLRVLEFIKIRDRLATFAVTEPGREMCTALLPSGDMSEVVRMQALTEEANTVIAYQGGSPVAWFSDVRAYLKLAEVGSTLSPKALLDVAECLRAARSMRTALVTDRDNTPLITAMASALCTNRPLEEEIFNAILSEDEISDHASSELYSIRRHIRQINDKMRDKLNSIVRSQTLSKYLMDSVITMRNGRYVIPVRADSRQFVPGLIHDQSASGSTLFIEPMSVVEAGNDLKQWAAKEKAEIERILRDFSLRLSPDAPLLRNNLDIMAEIDMTFAKALLGRDMKAVCPKINDRGRVNLIKARHPLIDPAKVVPSNIWIGDDFTTLVVTGPNTGGKTVTLKTVGLLTLMMQAGLQVPAAYGSEMSVFDEVFADIGDEQSIEQSLSTFSSHMTNIVNILTNVTERSLVLFDELGAGTDPTEGAALAISILETLLKRKIATLASTHYSELKAYALSHEGVENASVEFDVETLRPTYRLSIGIPGKSNAFEISRKLGLPESIIDDASERLSGDQVRFEDVIANAEYHRKIAEKERQLAEQAHIETQKMQREAEKIAREVESKREDLLKKAREEARSIITRAQRESEQVISELKKSRSSAALREHELHALRGQLSDALSANTEKIGENKAAEEQPVPTDVKP
ncbi:MAG: endonuclease MutS2, partial [Eubacteriales bacterium]|nr:endonuclease MutS2 [Eubacteriales bacterium]